MKDKFRFLSAKATAEDLYVAIFWLSLALVGFGLVMVFSATYLVSVASSKAPFFALTHQVIWVVLGIITMVVASKIRASNLTKLAPLVLIGSIMALGAVLIPGIGSTVYGSTRWITAGPIQIQPSEVAKLALVLFSSTLLAKRPPDRSFRSRTLPLLLIASTMALLIVAEPDLGTAILVMLITFGMLIGSGTKVFELVSVFGAMAFAATVLAFDKPYRVQRILAYLHPWAHRSGWSYQEVQALAAFATAHLTGAGVGAGQSSYNYLPNAQTDFIFAVVGQNLGLVGALILLLVLAMLVFMVFRAARHMSNGIDALFTYGIGCWIAAQVFLNVGAVEGILPVTGVPLPLVSAGGSSTVVLLVSLGLVRGSLRKAMRSSGVKKFNGISGASPVVTESSAAPLA